MNGYILNETVEGWEGWVEVEPPKCDAEGCTKTAVTALQFRGMPGHVHVCAEDEMIDREWCDVTTSAPMPCRWACSSEGIYVSAPTALT